MTIYEAAPICPSRVPSAPPVEPVRWLARWVREIGPVVITDEIITEPHKSAQAARAEAAMRLGCDPMDLRVEIAR